MMKTLSLIFITLAAITSGCSRRPSLQMTATQTGEVLVFQLGTSGINGLLDFTVWQISDDKVLWDVNLNYFAGSQLVYGETPSGFTTFNGITNNAVQRFPSQNVRPASLPPETNFRIQATVQYDTFATAAAMAFFFDARTDSSGSIIFLEPTRDLASLRVPKRLQENGK